MKNINKEQDKENTLKLESANHLSKPISNHNFIKLFFACMHTNNQIFFDRNSLRYDLYSFKSDDRYSDLFQDIAVKQEIEGDYLEIETALQNAACLGMVKLADTINSSKSLILLDDRDSEMIMICCGNAAHKMDGLVKEFINKKQKEIPVKKMKY